MGSADEDRYRVQRGEVPEVLVGKAEHTLDGSNLRFVVTSLKRTRVRILQ
jgi:hypothetical protein